MLNELINRYPSLCDCKEDIKKAVDAIIDCYEKGGKNLREVFSQTEYDGKTIGIFIGSEGGFEQDEVDRIAADGGKTATLGKRILRCETAPLAALSIIMYQTGNFE